jgi:hypothetical protein
MKPFKIRCSSLGKIMGNGRAIGLTETQKKDLQTLLEKPKLTEKQEQEKQRLIEKGECKAEFNLSQTAKTYVESLVRQDILEFEPTQLQTKEIKKGNLCEQDSINLYNAYHFDAPYKKNEIKMFNEWIQGTCDIDTGQKIVDLKTSWDKETFPLLPEEAENSDYEWQLRGYMMLYGREFSEVVFCLVTTPDYLLDFEPNLTLHDCDNIPIEIRVTICRYQRDLDKELQIIEKVKECNRYAQYYYQKIISKR